MLPALSSKLPNPKAPATAKTNRLKPIKEFRRMFLSFAEPVYARKARPPGYALLFLSLLHLALFEDSQLPEENHIYEVWVWLVF